MFYIKTKKDMYGVAIDVASASVEKKQQRNKIVP